uniref:Uncharacterized protein n=1 Tax=Romanomermis culicivorax TaxID=13658 RepID=A0A915JGP6_ROMCU
MANRTINVGIIILSKSLKQNRRGPPVAAIRLGEVVARSIYDQEYQRIGDHNISKNLHLINTTKNAQMNLKPRCQPDQQFRSNTRHSDLIMYWTQLSKINVKNDSLSDATLTNWQTSNEFTNFTAIIGSGQFILDVSFPFKNATNAITG